MKITGIIPARYASSRFPGKPLIQIAGKSMIQRVFEQAIKAHKISDVMVATDDNRIAEHLSSLQIPYVITSMHHQSGTDRCAEAAAMTDADAIINIQGDEPYINPEQIDAIALLLIQGASIATLVKQIHTDEELFNPHKPKVVLNTKQEALYFSRHSIPHLRNVPESEWLTHHTFYKHIGIYGYLKSVLFQLTQLPVSLLEQAESLEQLRWLENDFKIQCGITQHESLSVDTPEDLKQLMQ
jgi:3-deoxy-manno-octulosonate cytidylyltransferase (CMP-KDO synthetase)